ncbi:MAG: vitamin B12 transporter [Bacteroidia bacterium]|jgi:vitamin B12 transporter
MSRYSHPLLPVAFFLLLSGSPLALAQAQTLENVLVTGSYSPQEELTAAVTVLDKAQITALNKRSLAGLLQSVPGLLVEEQGGPGGLSAVSVRGGEGNFTLVLLDGVPINDPTNSRGGGFDFANLNTALVERVEVIRGPRSAVYGSDAVAGVINIVTRQPEEGFSQSLTLEVGQDDFLHKGIALQGRVDDFDYTLEVGSRDDGEPTPGSDRDADSANLRLGWALAPGHFVSGSFRYLDGSRSTYPEQSGGPEFAAIDVLDSTDYQDTLFAVSWRFDVTKHWQSRLQASRFEHEETFLSPGIAPFSEVPPNAADTQFTRDQLQWVNTLRPNKRYTLNMGADLRAEEGESVGYLEFFGDRLLTDFDLDRESVGVFADVSARPLEPLLLQGSVRFDDPDDFGSETTWQVGARYRLSPQLSVATNWGEAFKLPSFFALGHPLVGNVDLRPERAQSWDLGITWQPSNVASVSLTGFFNDFEDLVDFDDATFRNVNRNQVEALGAELQASWEPTQALSLKLHATYTDLDVKGEETTLTGRPEWSAGIIATMQVFAALHTTLDYRYGGEQWSASRHTGEELVVELDDYHKVDWVIAWQASRDWQLHLSVDNVLDETYETAVGFEAPGRALRLGIRYGN